MRCDNLANQWQSGTCANAKDAMICLDCFQKIDDFEFAGFMHHGSILPQDLSEKLFVEMELALQKKPGVA